MELDKTMEIRFSNIFYKFPKYFHTMEELQFVQCYIRNYYKLLSTRLNRSNHAESNLFSQFFVVIVIVASFMDLFLISKALETIFWRN